MEGDRRFRLHKDKQGKPTGGYDVLHPTRGWKRFCAKRVALLSRMA